MAGSDDETEVDATPVARAPAGELAPGTLLNGIYRIEAKLGVGGMGEVYRATNLANEEEDAIKIIGRGRADHTVIEAMFRKEARVLSRIRSPAVAQLKVFMRDPALNLLYFVTDFVPGESLLDRLKRQPATPDELRALMRRLLTGLQAVHEAGAVHRDLSPDNIILPDGDPAHAKIIDFGIAKELDPDQTTMIGDSFAGKLGYIAPEQLGFSGSKIGPWTDLYSLALVGAAFAAGKPLDMGATVGRAEETRRGAIDLSAVPEDLRPVFQKLLAYEWADRPSDAGEVQVMLEETLSRQDSTSSGLTTSSFTPITRHYKNLVFARRPVNRRMYLAIFAIILAIIIAGISKWDTWIGSSGKPKFAMPQLPIRLARGGMRYQIISRGDGKTKTTSEGWADIAIQQVRSIDGEGQVEWHRYRVPPDGIPIGLRAALTVMTKGERWRVWAPLPQYQDESENAAEVPYDITLIGVSGEPSCVSQKITVYFEWRKADLSISDRIRVMRAAHRWLDCPLPAVEVDVFESADEMEQDLSTFPHTNGQENRDIRSNHPVAIRRADSLKSIISAQGLIPQTLLATTGREGQDAHFDGQTNQSRRRASLTFFSRQFPTSQTSDRETFITASAKKTPHEETSSVRR